MALLSPAVRGVFIVSGVSVPGTPQVREDSSEGTRIGEEEGEGGREKGGERVKLDNGMACCAPLIPSIRTFLDPPLKGLVPSFSHKTCAIIRFLCC